VLITLGTRATLKLMTSSAQPVTHVIIRLLTCSLERTITGPRRLEVNTASGRERERIGAKL
jgi:hypothetical protein